MTEAEYELIDRIAKGESVFRPADSGPAAITAFAVTVRVLISLREYGWISLPESGITRDGQGWPLTAGPYDLTDDGRPALEGDRPLGVRR